MLIQSRQPSRFRLPPPVWEETENVVLSHRALDQLPVAIAVLDTQGTVLFCNARARQLALTSDAIKANAGQHLRFLDAEAERKFQMALRQFANSDPFNEESRITVVANKLSVRDHPLICTFRLLSDDPRTVLATLADSGCLPSETGLQRFMQAFHLTPAEQRLTHYLTSGGRLSAAAKSFGVSRHTVRNQLRSIFDKVGVKRQNDLTRLMLSGSAYGGIA